MITLTAALLASVTLAQAEPIAPGGNRPAHCRTNDPQQPCVIPPSPYYGPVVRPYYKGTSPGPYYDVPKAPPLPSLIAGRNK